MEDLENLFKPLHELTKELLNKLSPGYKNLSPELRSLAEIFVGIKMINLIFKEK